MKFYLNNNIDGSSTASLKIEEIFMYNSLLVKNGGNLFTIENYIDAVLTDINTFGTIELEDNAKFFYILN